MHLVVHYLDLFRHDLAWSWVWTNWIGNLVAGIVVFVTMTICWPRFRHFVERGLGITKLHEQAERHHKERTEQAEQHHKEALRLARVHHAEHLEAVRNLEYGGQSADPVKAPVAKKTTAVKKVVKR